jgi:hypothetical protein
LLTYVWWVIGIMYPGSISLVIYQFLI